MFDVMKEWIIKTVKSRLFVFWIVMLVIFAIVAQRLFTLQIINGKEYQDNYTLKIEKNISINGTRGSIYDRNGILLAHNELSYTITMEDTYDNNNRERPKLLNAEISTLIDMIEKNGDHLVNDLTLYMNKKGKLSFRAEGSQLQRFRCDIYGAKTAEDLKYNAKWGYNEATATPEQIYEYLLDYFGVDTKQYDRYRAYQIVVVRYALHLNSFQRYVASNVAEDVSDETVALIREHASELQGVEVREDTKRVYENPEYFSNIIGYTGKISTEEYEELKEKNDTYTLNDLVGKNGIESVMELQLQGKKGSETVYVNSLGKVQKVKSRKDPAAGNDVYLSIDANLQMAVYDLMEQELAGIIYSKIINARTSDSSELYIPIYDVYEALITNSVIDVEKLSSAKKGTYQAAICRTFQERKPKALEQLRSAMGSDRPYEDLSDEMQEYITYVVTALQDGDIFDPDAVDSSDEVYLKWRDGKVSVREYLLHALEKAWINISSFHVEEKYSDTNEIYGDLVSYVLEELDSDDAFDKIVYKYLIHSDKITGKQLCLALYEQGVLKKDEEQIQKLESGSTGAYYFLKDRIKNLDLTPAQLALDPCTGSCVLMDPDTGELLACVTYPGYDNNRLANSMDSDYYNRLLADRSNPLYNNATQQTTAPGSTFKMVSASAGLTEGVIDTGTIIKDKGVFDKLGRNLHCWVYPSNHGRVNVSQAIRDSCNYFFCEVGYRLSLRSGNYDEERGLDRLAKYAEAYGLGDKTGLEIPESRSKIADEFPIDAAIGQSNNNYTTAQLCRYVSAVANEGTVYDLTLLNKVTDIDGNTLKEFTPEVKNEITDIASSTWDAIHRGMRMVIGTHDEFKNLKVALAGKTGTAQESEKRPNHALFVGYAPYEDPEIAVAARIAYGYTSGNTCDYVDKVMKYYFKEEKAEKLITGKAANVGSSSNARTD